MRRRPFDVKLVEKLLVVGDRDPAARGASRSGGGGGGSGRRGLGSKVEPACKRIADHAQQRRLDKSGGKVPALAFGKTGGREQRGVCGSAGDE